MNKTWRVARHLVLPVIGALLATLWIIGAATIIDEDRPVEWIPFVLVGVAIGLSRLQPVAALALAGLALLAPLVFPAFRSDGRTWPIALGILVVIAVSATSQRPAVRWAAAVLAAGLIAVGIYLTGFGVPGLLVFGAIGWGVWGIGFGLRAGLDRFEGERRRRALEAEVEGSEAELALAVERDRIAQDVHDIMAHSLSVIVAQADGARFVRSKQPDAVDESLEAIADAARESLVEVRLLIEGLSGEADGHSHPSFAEIPALEERMRSAGLVIESGSHGEPAGFTLGQELALYRIVQESLTNALTHAGRGARVGLSWDWQGPGLSLVIASRAAEVGGITAGAVPTTSGRVTRGLPGMGERARLAGGWLIAEPDVEEPGRFVVTVFVPTAGALREERAGAAL